MNKAIRVLALAGMSLATGAMIGAGPAQAAPAAGQSTGSGSASQAQSPSLDRDYVVGQFRFQQACKRAGWTGIRRGAWDDYRCFPVRQGWRGLVWVLEVEEDNWRWGEWRGGWPGGWGDRPDYVGRPFRVGHPYHGGGGWDGPKGGGWDDHKGGGWDGPKGDGPKGDGPKGWNDDK